VIEIWTNTKECIQE